MTKLILTFIKNKSFLTVVVVLFFYTSGTAQSTDESFWKHVRYGGGIGLSFGDGCVSGTLAPSAIHEFNDQFALGVGLNATYTSFTNNYKSTILGGSIIGLYNPIQELQVSAEFEHLNVNRKWENNLGIENQNYWYPALFVGLGYRNENFTVGIRYDVLYDKNKSIYADAFMPFARIYF